MISPGFSADMAVRVVSELGERPSAENDPEARLTQVDLGARVSAKLFLHLAGSIEIRFTSPLMIDTSARVDAPNA